MKVFRLEDNEGIGPYTTAIPLLDWDNRPEWYSNMMVEHRDSNHPNAYEDRLTEFTSKHKFGLISLENLEEWFAGYLHKLLKYFTIVCYEVEEYQIGISGKQCIFIPTDNKTIIV